MPPAQVLRDEIGTAVRQIKSRIDQFSLIMHGQEGEGEEKEGFLKKEGAQVCGTQKMCPTRESWSLGFSVPQFVPHDHIHGQEGDRRQRKTPTKRESVQLCVGEKLEPRISAASICASSSSEVHATKKSSHGTPLGFIMSDRLK